MRPKDGGKKWCELGEDLAGRGGSRFGKLHPRRWHGTTRHRKLRQLAVGLAHRGA